LQDIIELSHSTKTALLTIEELFPFPETELTNILAKVKYGAKIYWVQ